MFWLRSSDPRDTGDAASHGPASWEVEVRWPQPWSQPDSGNAVRACLLMLRRMDVYIILGSGPAGNCRLNGYTTTLAPGARRPNGMTEVSKAFREYFRWRKRFAKLMPDFFDYAGAERRAREESERRQLEIELKAALDKVYGPLSTSDQLPATRNADLQPGSQLVNLKP